MKTSNKIFLGLLAAIALNVLTGMVILRTSLGPSSIGNGDTNIIGTKDIKKVRLTAADFKQISVGDNFQVTLSQGTEEFVEIETDANLIGYFEVKVNEDKTLYVDVKEGYSLTPTENVQVHIGFKTLKAIRSQGHCTISADQQLNFEQLALEIHHSSVMKFDVTTQSLAVRIGGSSKNELHGTTDSLQLNVFNSGKFEGQNFSTKKAKISINNSGTANLNISEYLDAATHNSGTLRYSGNPAINQLATGSGKIIKN